MALPPSTDSKTPKPGSRDEAAQDGFLREVDEALREEQMVNAFKRYAKPVGLAIGAVLLALGGYLYWDHTNKVAAGQWSERMVMAMDRLEAGQIEPAIKDLELISREGTDGNRAAALMQLAAISAQQGKYDEAAKKFAAIAADTKIPQPFRDLATIREVTLRFDTMKPEEVVTRMKPLAVPANAFYGSAAELLGMAYLEQNRPDLTGPLFVQAAKDKSVPRSIRSRMRQIASGLGFDAGIDNPELGGDGPAAPPSAPQS
ncbi:MAG: tetratricopeptide repeat protein [Sphingomonadales bacterium]|nr:tetratricopeptide repeat protein [Sphingomonadales bacterium]